MLLVQTTTFHSRTPLSVDSELESRWRVEIYLGGTSQARSSSGVLIVADGYGVDVEDVDIIVNGATVDVSDTNGIGISSAVQQRSTRP